MRTQADLDRAFAQERTAAKLRTDCVDLAGREAAERVRQAGGDARAQRRASDRARAAELRREAR